MAKKQKQKQEAKRVPKDDEYCACGEKDPDKLVRRETNA